MPATRVAITDVHHSHICGWSDTYCGHPHQDGIFNFGHNEIAVLHKHSPCAYKFLADVNHSVVHCRAKVVMQRSLDGGEHWEDGYTVVWDENAPLEQRMAFMQSKGDRPFIDLSSTDAAIYFGRTRIHAQEREAEMDTFAIRSADRGHTWEKHPTLIRPPRTLEGKHIHKNGTPLIRLADRYFIGVFYLEAEADIMLYGSGDNGLTWDYLSLIPGDTSGFGHAAYPGMVQTADGRLLCFTVNIHGRYNCLLVSESQDGYSWSTQRPIVSLGASPWISRPPVPQSKYQLIDRVYYRSPWPLRLSDNRIAVLFARRKPSHGIGLIASEDNGKTWSNEVIVRDGAPSSDLGYPVATQLDDGRIFTAYYYNDEPGGEFGGPRYIAGTHFRLK